MTYYVAKNDFYKGDVADAEKLMDELYAAAGVMSGIDQNNIVNDSINHTVAIPPNSSDTSNRHRGPFAAYNDSGLLYSNYDPPNGGTIAAVSLANLTWTEYSTPVTFTSRISSHYTFFLQAYIFRASISGVPLNVDASITLNGKKVERMAATSSCQRTADDENVPIFFTGTEYLEPGDWSFTAAFRPMVQSGAMPTIKGISFGAVGFIR
jgi:hypothetical protein